MGSENNLVGGMSHGKDVPFTEDFETDRVVNKIFIEGNHYLYFSNLSRRVVSTLIVYGGKYVVRTLVDSIQTRHTVKDYR